MDEILKNHMPRMLTGDELDAALRIEPKYDESIMRATEAERLIALQDLYSVYIPTDMSREVYTKLYLALLRSMSKKQSLPAIRQFSENQKIIKGKEYSSIIGGSDSFTVIGDSGIGKSATVSRVVDMISSQRVIDLPNSMCIIPCVQVQTPADCSVKGLLFEVLRKVDEILNLYYELAEKHGLPYAVISDIGEAIISQYRNYGKLSRKSGPKQREWAVLDEQYLPKVKEIVDRIYSFDKPSRVSVTRVERELGAPSKQLQKLPKCMHYVQDHLESNNEYRASQKATILQSSL